MKAGSGSKWTGSNQTAQSRITGLSQIRVFNVYDLSGSGAQWPVDRWI